jgi:ABC-type polar amino acid transport system ATPase subunit
MSVLRVRNLRVRSKAGDGLSGVDLDVAAGEVLVLLGGTGAGTATVLRAVAGLEHLDNGEVHVNDVEVTAGRKTSSRIPLRRKIGFVSRPYSLFGHISVIDNISLAPIHVQGLPRAEALARAREALVQFGLGASAAALPHELSDSEAHRVAIARALAMDPSVLLLHDPFPALDSARRAAFGQSLRALSAYGRAVVMTTDDLDFAREYATRVAILAEGRVVEAGDPRKEMETPVPPATRDLLQREPQGEPVLA